MKPALLIAVNHGMHVRNLLNSSILEELKRDFRIVIVSFAGDASFLAAAYGGPEAEVRPFIRHPARFEERFAFIRRYVLSNHKRNRTINVFSMDFASQRPLLYRLMIAANAMLGRFAAPRRAWLAIEAMMTPGREYDALFREFRPAALITADYGIGPDDIRLIRAARRAKVPSIAVVPSWDNLSSKGVMGAPPDMLVVWNDIMHDEAVELHDYRPQDVAVCGGVQFDVYGEPSRYGTREAFCARFGLDPARKFVVYGTITPVYFPANVRIVEMLAEASQRGELGTDAQILVRMHPQVVRDKTFGDRIEDYRRVAETYPGTVFLNIPEVEEWSQMSPPAVRDSILLGAMLHFAEAVIVPGSTLALDAIANDTPVVGVAFDGDQELAYVRSIRRWYDFTYYRPLVELGGLALAYSRDQMIAQVRAMLQDKSVGAAVRAKVVARYLGAVDGGAGKRVAAIIRAKAKPVA